MMSIVILALTGACAKNEEQHNSPTTVQSDPTILVDTFEREVWSDCSGATVVDKVVRRAAHNSLKVNPKRNIPIDSSSFVNMETGNEFVPHLIISGPGGDNYKFVTFCQPPQELGCDMAVPEGDNRIHYKFWSYGHKPCDQNPEASCRYDILEEDDIQTIHFSHIKINSTKICKRVPVTCPMTGSTQWGECQY